MLASHEIETHPAYSPAQHRGNTGEGQLHVRQDNMDSFAVFEVRPDRLAQAIRDAYQRQLRAKSTT